MTVTINNGVGFLRKVEESRVFHRQPHYRPSTSP